ncbi:competence protein TfoX [Oceanicola sp. 22II-s10i]|uniref:TfoX/Sxy family protein n=1 Tax=Oceanicola sp. 22II-s10i TaxID=1317116 RepID=UPI000B524B23|nr:TfoX/Sxy family protein [Oceanicola sp. 22II-s10i]OWU84441.1 competence protein TfoX [Oceanicola sp. 22II-s10i]
MAVDPEFLEHALELFSGLGPLRTGRMFSGVALYAEEDVMFAMIASSQVIYMKSDDATLADYEAAGSVPFTYTRANGERQVTSLMSLPDSAMDDPSEALDWARLSMGPARIAADKKRAEKARKAARKPRKTKA